MRIVFICSALEPRRDGVGDYTRRLACELIKKGHNIAIVALNDKYITTPVTTPQECDGITLSVLRLASSQPLKERLNQAEKCINEFNPDWLSLQFVIFGYHPKGLPLWLNKLALLGKAIKWHIMFHELWLGMETNASKKHLLWGKIQKQIISRMITKLKPTVIHTHTQLYKQKLSDIAAKSNHLPLFGNIPVISNNQATNLYYRFKTEQSLNMVLFGHIHPNAPVTAFAQEIAEYAKGHEFKLSLTLIGNNGAETENWIKQFKESGITLSILGEQPANYVSEIMSSANIGISTTPAALLEKSGSVAAMREHGLPVICVPCAWESPKFVNLELPGGIMIYEQGNLEEILNNDLNFTGVLSITEISNQFIISISKGQNG